VRLSGVDDVLLNQHGAVSRATAEALALECRKRTGSCYSIAVTGYAGPDGGEEEEPVGTVYIGLATPASVECERFHFPGDRDFVRKLATQAALDMLRVSLERSSNSN
jgi:nicotinamide-nucleotide amidase